MSANHNVTTPKLRATTRACHDGQLPAGTSTLADLHIRWTQGEAPSRTGFIAWGETARIETAGPDRFREAREQLAHIISAATINDAVNRPGSGIVAFGAFAFDDSSRQNSFLVIPKYIHAFDGTMAWNTTIEGASQPEHKASATTNITTGARGQTSRIAPSVWLEKVATAISRIRAHELDKVVLARAVDVTMPEPINEMALADTLGPAYPQCWTYAMEGLIGATPEMLVQVRDGQVMSRVLAGTISRRDEFGTASDARISDSERARALTTSRKDHGEHNLAVNSVADALRGKGIEVEVPQQPFVLELPNVMHLATDLHGLVPQGATALELAEALHPSAAVCGTPTAAAFEAIAELEELDRGLYSGPVGWVDGLGNGEWGIALRSGRINREDPRRITIYAGCGIVADSVPDEELAETEAKLIPMREALGLA